MSNYHPPYAVNWDKFRSGSWSQKVDTTVPLPELKSLAEKLTTVPPEFKLHARVEKVIADRRQMAQGKLPLDWGMAENLAYAALLKEGYAVRISGQDSGRGTFFHRHAVLHDQARERWDAGACVPLQHIAENQPDFVVIDSVLSEEAVLGFEYGYATAEPNELVIWEAQFGDFVNGAQVVIDQFIASGEVKWGRMCGLVLMLPHGYEGQGPEHSSARLERFLQLCADYNMQVCVPSTPAQMFHMLRRQMMRPYRKPLIIFSPKSMLRHKESVSSLEDLANGSFQPVIGETDDLQAGCGQARRVLQRQGVLRPACGTPRARYQGCRHRAAGAAVSVPARGIQSADQALRERQRDRVVPGGAGQPGRLASHSALSAAAHASGAEAVVCAAAIFGLARGRLSRAAQRAAESRGRRRAHPRCLTPTTSAAFQRG